MDISVSKFVIKVLLTTYILLVLFLNNNTYGYIPIAKFIESPVFTGSFILLVLIIAFVYDKVVAILLMIILCIWIHEYIKNNRVKTVQKFKNDKVESIEHTFQPNNPNVDDNGIFRLPKAATEPKPSGSYDLITFGSPNDEEEA